MDTMRANGTLSSLGVYSGKLQVPYDAFAAGLGDHRIVTTLCPSGKERMRRIPHPHPHRPSARRNSAAPKRVDKCKTTAGAPSL